MNEFQEQILENYKNPHNYGEPAWKPDLTSRSTNISCGDEVEIFIKQNNNIVENLGFIGRGCSISIASASLLTDELKGKSINEIRLYSTDDLKKLLGIELTSSRLVCATLPLEAIKKALD